MNPYLLLLVPITTIVCFPIPAHAYLDIGSVSVIFQAVIAVLVTSVFFIQTNWIKFKKVIKGFFLAKPKNGASNEKKK